MCLSLYDLIYHFLQDDWFKVDTTGWYLGKMNATLLIKDMYIGVCPYSINLIYEFLENVRVKADTTELCSWIKDCRYSLSSICALGYFYNPFYAKGIYAKYRSNFGSFTLEAEKHFIIIYTKLFQIYTNYFFYYNFSIKLLQ